MRVDHEGEPLATQVEVADSFGAKLKGLMFRTDVPEDYALVFRFSRPSRRSVHMAFVRTPIDVLWVAEGAVTRRATLAPWTGIGWAQADTIVELAAGAAAEVEAGDRVTVASG